TPPDIRGNKVELEGWKVRKLLTFQLSNFRTFQPMTLPQQLTSFIGREREIVEVIRSLQGARLVSLVGTGGCGKTRLSLEVASRLLDDFPDGVWFVEFAALSDPKLVPQAVASAMGLREETG